MRYKTNNMQCLPCRLFVYAKLPIFAERTEDKKIDMVDYSKRRVDFLWTIIFCLILLPGRLQAEPGAEDYLVTTQLSRDIGLPDPDINGICFDSRGYAWISTFGGGLVRYDGDSFIKFSAKTDPYFISDFVNRCCEDRFGRLWIPSAGGLNILDLKSLAFVDELPGLSREWRHSLSPGNISKELLLLMKKQY